MILDPEELIALTGRKHRDAQRKVLVAMGIDHLVRPDGSLVVARARVEHLLGAPFSNTIASPHEPDFAALAEAST